MALDDARLLISPLLMRNDARSSGIGPPLTRDPAACFLLKLCHTKVVKHSQSCAGGQRMTNFARDKSKVQSMQSLTPPPLSTSLELSYTVTCPLLLCRERLYTNALFTNMSAECGISEQPAEPASLTSVDMVKPHLRALGQRRLALSSSSAQTSFLANVYTSFRK